MRFSKSYDDWATKAETRRHPSDIERAQLTAAKIRDNHNGSAQDSRELARMERIAYGSGPEWGDDHDPRKAERMAKLEEKRRRKDELELFTMRTISRRELLEH